jgi:hypothetical protein
VPRVEAVAKRSRLPHDHEVEFSDEWVHGALVMKPGGSQFLDQRRRHDAIAPTGNRDTEGRLHRNKRLLDDE